MTKTSDFTKARRAHYFVFAFRCVDGEDMELFNAKTLKECEEFCQVYEGSFAYLYVRKMWVRNGV